MQGKLVLNKIHLHPKWFRITRSLVVELISVVQGGRGPDLSGAVCLLLQTDAHGEINNTTGSFKSSFVVKNSLGVCSVFYTKGKSPYFIAFSLGRKSAVNAYGNISRGFLYKSLVGGQTLRLLLTLPLATDLLLS